MIQHTPHHCIYRVGASTKGMIIEECYFAFYKKPQEAGRCLEITLTGFETHFSLSNPYKFIRTLIITALII